jgi:hypothetical protein
MIALKDALLRLVEKTRAKKESEDLAQLLHDTSRRLIRNSSIEFAHSMVSQMDFESKPNLLISSRNSRFSNNTDSYVPFNLKIKETM